MNSEIAENYTYRVNWSEEDQAYVGTCLEFPLLSSFGDTMEEALGAIRETVSDSLEILYEDEEPIPKPLSGRKYSGHLSLRIPPETHRRLAYEAQEQGVSLNQYITTRLESGYPPLVGQMLRQIRQELRNTERLVFLTNMQIRPVLRFLSAVETLSTSVRSDYENLGADTNVYNLDEWKTDQSENADRLAIQSYEPERVEA